MKDRYYFVSYVGPTNSGVTTFASSWVHIKNGVFNVMEAQKHFAKAGNFSHVSILSFQEVDREMFDANVGALNKQGN